MLGQIMLSWKELWQWGKKLNAIGFGKGYDASLGNLLFILMKEDRKHAW